MGRKNKNKPRIRYNAYRDSDGNWVLCGVSNKHHDKARSKGGKGNAVGHPNIFYWDVSTHAAFHFLFGNRTLMEAAEWLQYIHLQKSLGIEIDIMQRIHLDSTSDNDLLSNDTLNISRMYPSEDFVYDGLGLS